MRTKNKNKNYGVVTQEMMEGAKFLSEKGMTNATIARALKISDATVYRFKLANWDFAQYKANSVEMTRRHMEKVRQARQPKLFTGTQEKQDEVTVSSTELLEKIGKDLETLGRVATETMNLLQQILDFEHLKWEMRKEYIDKRNAEKDQAKPFFRR